MIKAKKGVALLWVLLLSVVLIIITGSMVTIITKESQASVRTENSVQAYAAAKTGVEWYLKKKDSDAAFTPGACPAGTPLNIDDGITASVCLLDAATNKIRSTGQVGNSKRSIEYVNQPVTYQDLPLNLDRPISAVNDGSFELIIKFVVYASADSDNASDWWYGLVQNYPSDLDGIGVYYNRASDSIGIAERVSGNMTAYSSRIPYSNTPTTLNWGTTPYLDINSEEAKIKAKIRYIKGEYATITFYGNYEREGRCLYATHRVIGTDFSSTGLSYRYAWKQTRYDLGHSVSRGFYNSTNGFYYLQSQPTSGNYINTVKFDYWGYRPL